MTTHSILIDLLGGVALLIWAARMVKTGILRAFEDDLRHLIRRATSRRLSSLVAGIGAAGALQSSTAAALLLVSFCDRGLIAVAPALAVMLGADIGSTLVVQALSFDIKALIPVFMIAGVMLFLNGTNPRVRQLGRIVIGLALMILALKMIVAASVPIRDSRALDVVLNAVASDPLVTVLIAAALTWLVHSSVAMVLLFMTLAGAGTIAPDIALLLVLGANVGAGLIPLGLAGSAGVNARRVLYGNLGFRVVGAAVALVTFHLWSPLAVGLGWAPERLLANGHTAFNVVMALAFLPFVGVAERMLARLVPEPAAPPAPGRPMHLDASLLDRPALAIGAAAREVMRLADLVEVMLRDAILTFESDPPLKTADVALQDNAVDELQEAIKLYLTALSRRQLAETDTRRCFDLILFTTNLEHVGDIIDKSLLVLADKKARQHVRFSDDGWREILALHGAVLEQLRLAVTVFVTQDEAMARDLVVGKDRMRQHERAAVESHLARLRDGKIDSIESSAVHLDVIRDLKRISAHVAAVAYPILEERGLIGASRLRGA